MPNFGGVAYKANPKAKTARGAKPYDSTITQIPPVDTRGVHNPAKRTENFTAASTKGMKANPKARIPSGAKPY